MSKERFHRGDLVHVAADLGQSMRHFAADVDAIVIGSYADQFGGSDHGSYTLHLKGSGRTSWYYGSQLTLIERNRMDKLEEWEEAEAAEAKEKGDLDWIFAHGEEVLKSTHGATIATLARTMGIDNLWGSRGEGFTYYTNAYVVMNLAAPFLLEGEKDKWLQVCRKLIDGKAGGT